MNIREAKEEIIRTVNAYRRKDETGAYEIPAQQQRPILLMGPPGIGKTAVMEQIAEACGIGLVSYTITHHTRQSAIGLPMIAHRMYGEKEHAVTEYTMSEIVASVYEKIEQTGIQEGILFLDEINCVSETLAPTMLQFLQYKTFGTHRVPDGWLIVTAGNPPQYNRAAREFDIVTLDRVKKMEIEADFGVWKEYAYRAGVHGAVLSYLEVKQHNFYVIRTELDGRHFVTARGWEDLSRMLTSYEKMKEPVTEQMVIQYLQDAEIAKDFTMYYELYRKYSELYQVKGILAGAPVRDPEAIRTIPFDEKLSLIRLLVDGLHQEFTRFEEARAVQEILFRRLSSLKTVLSGADKNGAVKNGADENGADKNGADENGADKNGADENGADKKDADKIGAVKIMQEIGADLKRQLKQKSDAAMISRENARQMRLAIRAWDELISTLAGTTGRIAAGASESASGGAIAGSAGISADSTGAAGSAGQLEAADVQLEAADVQLEAADVQPEAADVQMETADGQADSLMDPFMTAKAWFAGREAARQSNADETGRHLENAFSFLTQVYGTGQELVMFLTELNADWYCLQFINARGSESYDKYNRILLMRDRREAIRRDIINMTL